MTPFGSTVMSPMEENGLAPFEGGSESSSRVKADWNCLLQMLAFSLESVLRIPFSLSDVIPYASFLSDLTNDQGTCLGRNQVNEQKQNQCITQNVINKRCNPFPL